MLTFSDNMSFTERWYNTMVGLYDWIVRKFVYLRNEEEFTHRFFANLEPLPSMDELLQKVAVILVNTHRALSPPRPAMPGLIQKIHFLNTILVEKYLNHFHCHFSCDKHRRCSSEAAEGAAKRSPDILRRIEAWSHLLQFGNSGTEFAVA